MVGHTHEDIDQMFSCFSRHLAKNDARTIPELFDEMEKAYTPTPTCEQLLQMFDVKEWMSGHLVDTISGHVHQHQFKLEMKEGNVLIFYKKWSTTKDWIHLKPEGNSDELYSIIRCTPNGSPNHVKPFVDPLQLSKISRDLVKFHSKFDTTTLNWWKKVLEDLQLSKYTPIPWCLDDLVKANKRVPLTLAERNENDVELRASKEIEKLLEKETSNTEVNIE